MLASPLQVSPRVNQTSSSLVKDSSDCDQENRSPGALAGKRSPIGESHFSSLLPTKRLKFSANSCGLESSLSEMNVEGSSPEYGYATPTRVEDLPIVKNANSSRKRGICSFSSSPPSASHPRLEEATMNALQTLTQQSLKQMCHNSSKSLKKAVTSPRKLATRQPKFCPTPSTCIDNPMNDSMDDETPAVSVLRRTFEQRYAYRRRLKQLPSQMSQNPSLLSPSTSNVSISSRGSSSGSDKVHVEDALKIFEEMLSDREKTIQEEFRVELEKQLSEQYDQLMRYNEEYVRSSISSNNCSYLS